MMDKAYDFIRREMRSFVADAVRMPAPTPAAPDEGRLAARATDGAAVRQFLESEQVQDFMARSEANLTAALISLPLENDEGRRNLAVAIQTQRQLLRYLAELARDGRSAEAELMRLRDGKAPKPYF